MATYKPLGAVNPAATTWTALYTCGVSAGAAGSTISAVNTGSTVAKIRIAHRPLGAALATAHYLTYDIVLQAAGTNGNEYSKTIGLGIQNTDVIAVYADTANVAFILEGVENP